MPSDPLPRGRLVAFLELAAVLLLVPLLGILAVELTGVELRDGITGVELLQVKAVEIPLVLLLMARVLRWQGRSFAALGWSFPRPTRLPDLRRGLLWVVPLVLLAAGVSAALQASGFAATEPFRVEGTVEVLAFLLVGILAGGVVEELLYRGFVFQQLESILPARGASRLMQATVLTAMLFALPHGYEGSAAVGAILVIAIALQLLYLRSGRRLLAPTVCHAAFNALQIALLASGVA